MMPARFGLRNWTGDRFTAILMGAGHCGGGAAGFAQHPLAERFDQPGLLGDRDELGGETRPRSGWRQRTSASAQLTDLAGEVDHRLEVEGELVLDQRLAQISLERATLAHLHVHVGIEEAVSVAALGLGPVQRDVGIAEQLVGVDVRIGRHGDADAGADAHLMAVDIERRPDGFEDALGECAGVGRTPRHGLQDGELVAAEAGHRVEVAGAGEQARADGLQQGVAGRVAERVVDRLELVEVDAQEREPVAVTAQPHQRLVEPLVQQHAVGEVGERVMPCHVGDARLVALAVGDVGVGRDHAALGEGSCVDLDHRAVGALALVCGLAGQAASDREELPDARIADAVGLGEFALRPLVRADVVELRSTGEDGLGQLQECERLAVHHRDVLVGIDHDDALAHVVEGDLELARLFRRHGLALLPGPPVPDAEAHHDQDQRRERGSGRIVFAPVGQIALVDVVLREGHGDDQRMVAHLAIGDEARRAVLPSADERSDRRSAGPSPGTPHSRRSAP